MADVISVGATGPRGESVRLQHPVMANDGVVLESDGWPDLTLSSRELRFFQKRIDDAYTATPEYFAVYAEARLPLIRGLVAVPYDDQAEPQIADEGFWRLSYADTYP